MNSPDTLESVRQYYGEVLTSSRDLKTSACCSAESLPAHVRGLVQHVHPEVQERLRQQGTTPLASTPEAFARLIAEERVRVAQIAQRAGIRLDD